jgi:hypothetical protein
MIKKLKINTDQVVFILTIISIIWIMFYKIVFIKRDEIFPYAEIVSDLFHNICLSIISSSIFYCFVVYLERKRIQKKTISSIQRSFKKIKIIYNTILTSMYKINNIDPPSEFLDVVSFIKTFTIDIELSSKPEHSDYLTVVNTTNDWYNYFKNSFKEIKECTDIIYNNIGYIPEDLISATNNIQKSYFEEVLKNFKHLEYNSKVKTKFKLHTITPHLYDYLVDLKKVSEYRL